LCFGVTFIPSFLPLTSFFPTILSFLANKSEKTDTYISVLTLVFIRSKNYLTRKKLVSTIRNHLRYINNSNYVSTPIWFTKNNYYRRLINMHLGHTENISFYPNYICNQALGCSFKASQYGLPSSTRFYDTQCELQLLNSRVFYYKYFSSSCGFVYVINYDCSIFFSFICIRKLLF